MSVATPGQQPKHADDADYPEQAHLYLPSSRLLPPTDGGALGRGLRRGRFASDRLQRAYASAGRPRRGARDSNPAVAARAQERFDCWVEQQEENHQAEDIAACRDDFLKAMEELEPEPLPVAPNTYIVLFDFDRSNINNAGQAVLDQVLAEAAKTGGVRISATGHADRSGPEDYNMALSLRRADSVREALIAGGVSADAITVADRGESEPAVPTPDGVKEQANRRVEIVLQ
jgi:OOP family OmpA-OmpF porin